MAREGNSPARSHAGSVTRQTDEHAVVADLPQGIVTFLFTDVARSTELVKKLGERYGQVLARHRALLRAVFVAHGGVEVDTQGDSFFVAFARPRDGVAAAVAAQRALAGHRWPDDAPLAVRMGLHTGEAHAAEHGYVGIAVHRAARICTVAHGGQVLLSRSTAGISDDEELPGVALRDLGEHRLKDLDRPERIWQLVIEGLPSTFPPLRTIDQQLPLLGAVAAQHAVATHDWPHGLRPEISVGLHSGEAGIGWIGPAVLLCEEICDVAEAGQIFMSQATAGLLEHENIGELRAEDLGALWRARRAAPCSELGGLVRAIASDQHGGAAHDERRPDCSTSADARRAEVEATRLGDGDDPRRRLSDAAGCGGAFSGGVMRLGYRRRAGRGKSDDQCAPTEPPGDLPELHDAPPSFVHATVTGGANHRLTRYGPDDDRRLAQRPAREAVRSRSSSSSAAATIVNQASRV
jgi:class 3 adenylate cyclase